MVADAALVGAARAVVLHPEAREHVNAAVEQLHRDLHAHLAVRGAEHRRDVVAEVEPLGRAAEPVVDDLVVRDLGPRRAGSPPSCPDPRTPGRSRRAGGAEEATMSFDAAQVRAGQRHMWSPGDWPAVAESIQPVADALVERLDMGPGQEVLDVGAGNGNVALRAAERGARVTGSDITVELFESGRGRAAEAGVEIDWSRGTRRTCRSPTTPSTGSRRPSVHVRAPPSGGGGRDRPRLPAGWDRRGRGWTAEGLNGRMLKLGLVAPGPAAGGPVLDPWGSEEHMPDLFAGKAWSSSSSATWPAGSFPRPTPGSLAREQPGPDHPDQVDPRAGRRMGSDAGPRRGALRGVRRAGRGLAPRGRVPAHRGAPRRLARHDAGYHLHEGP